MEEPMTIKQARKRESVHGASRLQDTWTADNMHEAEDKPWVKGGSFPKIPARPGFRQRWVRVAIRGAADPTNISRKFQEGWKPRHPDTVPPGIELPTIAHGEWAGCIGIEGSVLCELPDVLGNKRDKAVRQRTDAITNGIEADLQKESHPLMPITQERTSSSRLVKVAPDEN